MTRGGFADDLQPCARSLVVCGVGEGIAVDRGVVVRRNGARRDDGLGEKAARGVGQRHLLDPDHRPHPRLSGWRCASSCGSRSLSRTKQSSIELGRHAVRASDVATMKSAMPAISSRWNTGRASPSRQADRRRSPRSAGKLPASGSREAAPSRRISIFGKRLALDSPRPEPGRRAGISENVLERHFGLVAKLAHQGKAPGRRQQRPGRRRPRASGTSRGPRWSMSNFSWACLMTETA